MAGTSGWPALVTRWMLAHLALVATLVVGLGVALTATWGAGEVYESVVERGGLAGLDQPALDLAVSWRRPGLDAVVAHFTDLGGPVGLPVLAALAVVAATLAWRSPTPLVLVVVAGAGSLTMSSVGKVLTARARPPESLAVPPFPSSPSFPSGHTLNTTVVTGIVVYLLLLRVRRTWARVVVVVLGVVFAAAVGLSRVFLGHHWLTDVIAGWLFALGWLAVVVTAHRLFLGVRRPLVAPRGLEPGAVSRPGGP